MRTPSLKSYGDYHFLVMKLLLFTVLTYSSGDCWHEICSCLDMVGGCIVCSEFVQMICSEQSLLGWFFWGGGRGGAGRGCGGGVVQP